MDNRPIFGERFDNNPDGAVRLWLARVGALIDRVGISESARFRASLGTLAQYWKPSINSLQVEVRNAIEALKLEFDLYPEDNIGQVYSSGETFKFLTDVLALLDTADSSVFVVDPYFDSSIFTQMFSPNFRLPIRVLCNNGSTAVACTAAKFSTETGVPVEVRKSSQAHDRLIILDYSECWLVGASIKDGGKKPTYLIPIRPEIAAEKIGIYSRMWNSSEKPK
jgi:hypothetical protein